MNTIIDLICTSVQRRGAETTLTYGDQSWSGLEVFDHIESAAALLSRHGAGRGKRVAIIAGDTPFTLFAFLGALRTGACVAPMSPSLTDDALHAALKSCEPVIVVTDQPNASRVPPGTVQPSQTLNLAAFMERDGAAWRAHWPSLDDADPCTIIYSSGTTGTPKGIVHSHGVKLAQADMACAQGIGASSVLMSVTPLYSNTTLVVLLPVLAAGGRIVMLGKFDAGTFLRISARERATTVIMVPVQYQRILDHEEFSDTDLDSYALKVSTGAPMAPRLKLAVAREWPGRFLEVYGSTEGDVSTLLDVTARPDKAETVGQAAPDFEVRVIDDAGEELPLGAIGELVGRSPTMTDGYFRAADATAELFWCDRNGETFLRSGDLGSIDVDGFVTLHGRKKDMIISGGFNIYAVDLEAVLEAHPDIVEAAVIAVPSKRWGETPAGYVVVQNARVTSDDILTYANEQLGKTQRLASIVFCEALPRNALGKILKKDLQRDFIQKVGTLT